MAIAYYMNSGGLIKQTNLSKGGLFAHVKKLAHMSIMTGLGSLTQKLLDFLKFILTDPMVPNLAHGFLLGWVSKYSLTPVFLGLS